jgi:hypothetical protein
MDTIPALRGLASPSDAPHSDAPHLANRTGGTGESESRAPPRLRSVQGAQAKRRVPARPCPPGDPIALIPSLGGT